MVKIFTFFLFRWFIWHIFDRIGQTNKIYYYYVTLSDDVIVTFHHHFQSIRPQISFYILNPIFCNFHMTYISLSLHSELFHFWNYKRFIFILENKDRVRRTSGQLHVKRQFNRSLVRVFSLISCLLTTLFASGHTRTMFRWRLIQLSKMKVFVAIQQFNSWKTKIFHHRFADRPRITAPYSAYPCFQK